MPGMRESEFEELMKQYQNLVFTVCYQLVEDYQEAQNLTQETFLAAYRFVDNCEGKHIRPWLCRVAANKAKDFLKSSYRRRTQLDGEGALAAGMADPSPPPELQYIQRESRERVAAAIEGLKEPYRSVLALSLLEERTATEIAVTLGRPLKTVQTQLARGRERLKKQLEGEREDDAV